MHAKSTHVLEALALKPCDIGNNQYKRVGIIIVCEDFYGFYTANEADVDSIITLV
jgi:hypothetical protein